MVKKRRVVVTGLGVLAANGIGKEEFWASLVAGRSGIGPITLFDASELETRIAGEVKNFQLQDFVNANIKPGRMARHTQLALAASRMALDDARLPDGHPVLSKTIQVTIGVSSSAFDLIEMGMAQLTKRGVNRVSPFVVRASPPQAVTSAISEHLNLNIHSGTISTACAAGLDAIAHAAAIIQSGNVDVALAGGADAPITPLAFATFQSAGLMSTQNTIPEKASRPFDRKRESGVIAEGAGVVVLESYEHAVARGAPIYMEITGYGTSLDVSQDEPESGLEDAMRIALANAHKRSENLDYICAHGPGHPALDVIETETIKKIFGEYAYQIPVSSIKGVTGNPLSAGGAIQVISCALAFNNRMIPPTANYEYPDPDCDLDYVGGQARLVDIRCALINAHGIGGANSCLVVEKIKHEYR